MPFILVLPFIVIGIVIAATKKAAEQNKRAEAQRRAAQMQQQKTASEGQASYTPVRPSVQPSAVRRAQPTIKTQAYQSPLGKAAQTHPQHEDCSLRPDAKVAPAPPWKHPQHEDCSVPNIDSDANGTHAVPAVQTGGATYRFTPDEVLNGVIFSEILGKPKALR